MKEPKTFNHKDFVTKDLLTADAKTPPIKEYV